MRWAEVFKINSDMTKPLNTLINEFNTWITGQVQGTNNNVTDQHAATNNKIDGVYNLVNRGAVKSVQHFSFTSYNTGSGTDARPFDSEDIPISWVNMSKSVVIISSNVAATETEGSGNGAFRLFQQYAHLTSATNLKVRTPIGRWSIGDRYSTSTIRGCVIEFY